MFNRLRMQILQMVAKSWDDAMWTLDVKWKMETIVPSEYDGNMTKISAKTNLLTFVDVALALDKPQVDHTYASHKRSKFSNQFQKERDHSYSIASPVVLYKSLVKENNVNSCACPGSGSRRKDVTESTDHTYARETVKQHCSRSKSSATMPSQENSNFELLSKLSITSDHTYTDNHSDCTSFTTRTRNKSSLIRFDHSYVYKNSIPNFVEQSCDATLQRLEYVTPPITERPKDHNYSGSCESLDENLSASETDSCDETNENVTKIAFTAWCQLRKDHPYSSF